MKNKFVLGLVTALILGIFVKIISGYINFGYFKNPDLILGGLFKNKNGQSQVIDKNVKNCKNLVSGASTFGNLKVVIVGNGKPVENLEVDLSNQPGPIHCMQKTDKKGTVLFEAVPAGKMFIFFNNNAFPKEFGHPPTETGQVTILQGQLVEKTLELKTQ